MDEIIAKYIPNEAVFDALVDEFSTELNFASNRIEQGNDVYQYLLSVTPNEEVLTQLVVLLAATYGGTEFHESMELTVANRFEFKMEDFIDD